MHACKSALILARHMDLKVGGPTYSLHKRNFGQKFEPKNLFFILLIHTVVDCLYANIWKPSNATAASKLPVLCFINGGSWEFGEPEPYNGSALAYQHGVIYASIAYRTGPIGFAAFEADSKQGNTTGNWGMMDMQSGLRWLKREVANFGGDPDRITIHGQVQCLIEIKSKFSDQYDFVWLLFAFGRVLADRQWSYTM